MAGTRSSGAARLREGLKAGKDLKKKNHLPGADQNIFALDMEQ